MYDRFKRGEPREDAPEGYVQFSNGEMGFVKQLCAKDPKLLDAVGSDLVNDWGRYCQLPSSLTLEPDPTEGCLMRLVTYDVSADCQVRLSADEDAEWEPRVFQNEYAHWEGARDFTVGIGVNPAFNAQALVILSVTNGCNKIESDYYGALVVGQQFEPEYTVVSIDGASFAYNGPFLDGNGNPVTEQCCELVEVYRPQSYIRRGTYTRSEWLRYVLPELVQMFLPNPFSFSRGLRRGFGFADDIVGFAPKRAPVVPGRVVPGKPLPLKDFPGRRGVPSPRPRPAPRPAPKPGKPLPNFPRPGPKPPKPYFPKPTKPLPDFPAPFRPLPPIPGPNRTPNPVRRQPGHPFPNVRPPAVPRTPPSRTAPPVKVPAPAPWRQPRPARPPQRAPFTPRVPAPMIRPKPVPSPKPSPTPKPFRPTQPVPSPNKPGVPQRRPTPQPLSPRPYRPPTPSPPVPSTSPKAPGLPRPQSPSRTPFPTPQSRPRPQPFQPYPPPAPYSPPSETVIPLPEPLRDPEGEPIMPVNQSPCPPCPTVVINRSVPVMIPGPQGPPGKDGKDGEDGEDAAMTILVSESGGAGSFAQTLSFTEALVGKSTGTLPRNISRVVLRYGQISDSTPVYGQTETGDKVGGFGTVALVLNDVIVHQYSLNRFQDTQLCIPYSVDQTVELFISPIASCVVTVLDEGDRWKWVKVSDPDNLPEISTTQLN